MTTATEPVGVSKMFPGSLLHFDLKIAIRWVAFKIDSIEASTVAPLRFKDPARDWGRGEGGGEMLNLYIGIVQHHKYMFTYC